MNYVNHDKVGRLFYITNWVKWHYKRVQVLKGVAIITK